MEGEGHREPGITTLLGRLLRTGLGAAQNRFELLSVEWQEERLRLAQLLGWTMGLVFLGMMGMALVTAAVIFLCAQPYRVYAVWIFAALYLAGALLAWRKVRTLLKREPFEETLDQARKDREWLKSLD
jgi:uncharacterized membrane protein YqjE